jgi:DNA-binding MarR family transcriptional regulator
MATRAKSSNRQSSLTPKQLRVLTFIRDFSRARGYAPTMQELADEFGRKQGYGVRAHRGAATQGVSQAIATQGTLFAT